jgi:hypothetical protein
MRKLKIMEHISLDGVIQQSADPRSRRCYSNMDLRMKLC